MGLALYHVRISPVLRENTDFVEGHSIPKSCMHMLGLVVRSAFATLRAAARPASL